MFKLIRIVLVRRFIQLFFVGLAFGAISPEASCQVRAVPPATFTPSITAPPAAPPVQVVPPTPPAEPITTEGHVPHSDCEPNGVCITYCSDDPDC